MLKFIKDVQTSYQKYLIANKTIKELSSLTDKELSDIGIPRSSIRSVAWDIEDSDDVVNHNLRGWV